MASNYTGNATAAQAPSGAPAVNTDPIGSLAQDTDGNTVANFYQVWKVPLDWLSMAFKMLGGTRTTRSLHADGVGGNVSTLAAGYMQAKAMNVDNLSIAASDPGAGHIRATGAAPTVTAGAASGFSGSGTGGSGSVSGADSRGKITLTTGTSCVGSASVLRVNFNVSYGLGVGAVLLAPANAAAAARSGAGQVYVDATAVGNFTMASGSTALADSTTYEWWYWVIG